MDIKILKRKNIGMTNVRLDAVGEGFRNAGHSVEFCDRTQFQHGDLIVQHGFKSSQALTHCCDAGRPYIIIEHPHWRRDVEDEWASFGYNGLGGRQFLPETPDIARWYPSLHPVKAEGSTIIFAQKPNDHSLQGHDHVKWLKRKLVEWPGAEFRHHPLMSNNPRESIDKVLDRCFRAITYSSTVGGEALIAGCISHPESSMSVAFETFNREKWAHETAWRQFTLDEYTLTANAGYILSGYEEARERASRGLIQRPVDKVSGICGRYHEEFGN